MSEPFDKLLASLDPDRDRAAERYGELRSKLASFFKLRGCTEADMDELVDKSLDRLAQIISQGEVVEKLGAYSHSVARYVWLEQLRRKEVAYGDNPPEIAVQPVLVGENEPSPGMGCLNECLAKLKTDERKLILTYYDAEANEKNKDQRKKLAEALGISLQVLKVKACRLRDKLKVCITGCVARLVQ